MEQAEKMKALYVIVNAGFGEEAVEIVRAHGAAGGTIFNARGTGAIGKYGDSLLFEPEKEIILSLVPEKIADNIMHAIKTQVGVETKGNGVCFLLPVDKMSMINKTLI